MKDEYRISDDGRFGMRLSARNMARLVRLCRNADQKETGGILVGRYDEELRCAVVTEITGPPAGSKHERYAFYRAVGDLQRLLDRRWNRHEGYYLGEWHYHPGGPPEPSGQDHNQMFRIAGDNGYSCPEPLLLILGSDLKGDCCIGATVFTRAGKVIRLRRLRPSNPEDSDSGT